MTHSLPPSGGPQKSLLFVLPLCCLCPGPHPLTPGLLQLLTTAPSVFLLSDSFF